MRRTMIGAVAGLLVLAGCTGTTEPAQPPTQEDALTTATVAPAPPPDEAEVTTEPPVTSDEDEETETPEVGGPPEMPDEAKEQTQEGAIAFAEHFVEVVNYTGIEPVPGLLSKLASHECQTCANLESTVVYSEREGNYLERNLWDITDSADVLIFTEDGSVVRLPVKQHGLPVVDRDGTEVDRTDSATYNLAFDLAWVDDSWRVVAMQFG